MQKRDMMAASLFLLGAAAWSGVATASSNGSSISAAATGGKADMAAAATIFQKSCRACHGNKAQGASVYPRLADKTPKYIAAKLKRFRAGETFGPNSALMIPQAKKLSDQDIASLSVYITTAFK